MLLFLFEKQLIRNAIPIFSTLDALKIASTCAFLCYAAISRSATISQTGYTSSKTRYIQCGSIREIPIKQYTKHTENLNLNVMI
jgi:hypothetical protein